VAKAIKFSDQGSSCITLIDGHHAANSGYGFPAWVLMSNLKKEKLMLETYRVKRYRATHEWLIYGSISSKAIIYTVTMDEVKALAEQCSSVNKLLRLPQLEGSKSIKDLRMAFLSNPLTLDESIGVAISKLCRLFGVTPLLEGDIISYFIFTILQGWVILDAAHPLHRQKAVGAFIAGITEGRQCSAVEEEKLWQAFEDGVDRALEDFESLGGILQYQRKGVRSKLKTTAKAMLAKAKEMEDIEYIFG